MRGIALVVLIAVAGVATPLGRSRQQPAPADLDVVQLLELYESGRFDDALARVKAASDRDARALRQQLRTAGSDWIDAARPNHGHRLLVAAAFALETEILRVERRDWGAAASDPPPVMPVIRQSRPGRPPPRLSPALEARFTTRPCQTICMLDWSQMLLIERGMSDAAVHAWFHGAIALAEGQRDWRYVYTLLGPDALAPARGLAHEAMTAFPDDTWFQFDRALAMAARYNVTRDGVAPGSTVIVPAQPAPTRITIFQEPNRAAARMTLGGGRAPETGTADVPAGQPVSSADELSRLSADPVVGIDAQIRLGYLQWATGDSESARATLKTAAAAAQDADRKYLAHFLAGWTALRDGRDDIARESLAAALDARPGSQSATLALASLNLRLGEADLAHEQAEASLAQRATDDDPWRLFLYGRFPTLPKLISDLRDKVRR